jgi:hypothetical protein
MKLFGKEGEEPRIRGGHNNLCRLRQRGRKMAEDFEWDRAGDGIAS